MENTVICAYNSFFRVCGLRLLLDDLPGAREEYLSAGFDDYLTKPIDSTKLEEMLIHFLPDEKIEDPTADDIKDMPKDLKECTSAEKGL